MKQGHVARHPRRHRDARAGDGRRRLRRRRAANDAGTTAALPGEGKPAVTIGTKNFTEQFVLGQLYKQALEAEGFTVALKQNIGSTEIADKALRSGQIDLYPEYIGIFNTVVAGDTTAYPTSRRRSRRRERMPRARASHCCL